ncbi:MAG: DUF3427 domain-containing protein [Arcanobacterium sp.]
MAERDMIHNESRDPLLPGLYESVIDTRLVHKLPSDTSEVITTQPIDDADLSHIMGEHVKLRLESHLRSLKPKEAVKLVDEILERIDSSELSLNEKNRAQQLLEVRRTQNGNVLQSVPRPNTPLTDAALLTNASNEPNIQAELQSEFYSADGVDIIMAFVKWAGISTLDKSFRYLADRGIPIRLITSTYMGVTERRALDRLVHNYDVQIRIAYDEAVTRLHAKSWLIRRNTGFHTAYIGSSNLSRSAMTDGLEWNVRLSPNTTPAVFNKFEATFNSYWESSTFEEYNPERDATRLDNALDRARNYGRPPGTLDQQEAIGYTPLEVHPYPYQRQMLNELEAARRKGYHHNLLVAATGTGKTVVAALDWVRVHKRLFTALGRKPRTLFVAHRKEILRQAVRTFRDIAKDPNLGFLSVGQPITTQTFADIQHHSHALFTSIQSLHEDALRHFHSDSFDIVIIDEFHHAEARTYRRLLDHLEPRELLGMTATPERTDGKSVAIEFFGGRIASEMRLWEALEEDILVPFHYFMTNDGTDLSRIELRRGEYDTSQLSLLYTADDARARLITQAIDRYIIDPTAMRALCFCVDINHSNFMAEKFAATGLNAVSITSQTPATERDQALLDLRDGRIQMICAVDIFNEGVDVPAVDTILMLRPTSSPTVFLQQLGRGLRRSPNKSVLTVLDFVGNQAKDFQIDRKLAAITGKRGRALEKAIKNGFATLPSGCQIILDEYSQDTILRSLRDRLDIRFDSVVNDVRRVQMLPEFSSGAELTLTDYLEHSFLELPNIYARTKTTRTIAGRENRFWSWWRIKYLAATGREPQDEFDNKRGRLRVLARVDDLERAQAYLNLLRGNMRENEMSATDRCYAYMLIFSVWPTGKRNDVPFESLDEALNVLRSIPGFVDELDQIFEVSLRDGSSLLETPEWEYPRLHDVDDDSLRITDVPLKVGASYTREELFAAFGLGWNFIGQKPGDVREGVKYIEDLSLDVLLVTLKKSSADFSPQTMYRDYAMSPQRFHWESQSTTSSTSPTGKRYAAGKGNVALFVREAKEDTFNGGAAYTFAGPVSVVSSQGSKPMQVVWDLQHELDPELYVTARAVAGV